MFSMLHFKLLFALALAVAVAAAPKEIYDPFFVFCGSKSCYEILEIRRNATTKQVRRAYRRLSLEYHPDKSKHANATEAFRLISKAYEVLDGNETRVNFDYYLNHPRDYFKVSGHHYMRTLPKSDVRLVIILVACLISWMMHVMQEHKHQSFMKHLKDSVLKCAGNAKSNNQTLALFKRCQTLYEAKMKEATWAGSGTTKPTNVTKMVQDPLFADCVSEIVATVKIEGGYRKPDTNDLFIVRLVYLPLTIFNWYVATTSIPSHPLPPLASLLCI
jgi:DnaJ family protein C protein 25